MALVVLLAVLLAGAARFGYLAWQRQRAANAVRAVERDPLPAVDRACDASADELVENPVDFEALRLESADVYAWLYEPNTNVNLPRSSGREMTFSTSITTATASRPSKAQCFPRWRTLPSSPIPSPCCTATTS